MERVQLLADICIYNKDTKIIPYTGLSGKIQRLSLTPGYRVRYNITNRAQDTKIIPYTGLSGFSNAYTPVRWRPGSKP